MSKKKRKTVPISKPDNIVAKPPPASVTTAVVEEQAAPPTTAEAVVQTPPVPAHPPKWNERLGQWALAGQWWLLGGVLVLAAFLRFYNLGERSLWYDESFSLTLANRDIATLLSGTANDYHPPLPYLLLKGWMTLFGDSVDTARVLSALFGVGFVAVLYGLAREMFGSRTALLAALFAAVAPFQILYAQEVRHYSLQALLGTWLVWAFYRAWQRGGWLHWGHYGLAGVVSLYNLYFSIFSLATLNLFFISVMLYQWQKQKNWPLKQGLGWLAANGAIAALYAPWTLALLQQAGKVGKAYWIQTPNPLEIFRLTNVLLLNATNLTTPELLTTVGLLLGAITTFFLFYACVRFRLKSGPKGKRRRSFEIGLLLVYWFGTVTLVLVVSYLYAPLYLERSLLGIAAPCYILLGRVVQTARRPALWLVLLVPGLFTLLGALYFYYYSPDYTTHYDNEGAVARIKAAYQPGDLTLHSSKLGFLPFAFLKTPGQQFLVPEEPGNLHDDLSQATLKAVGMAYTPVSEVLAQVPKDGRLWWVRTNPQPGQTEEYLDGIQTQLAARYRLVERWPYHGGELFLYA